MTRYPTQDDIFATVRDEGIFLDKFLNKINFNLSVDRILDATTHNPIGNGRSASTEKGGDGSL